MKYYLHVKQRGEGCDYTIGCGQSTEPLNATTREDAKIEARAQLLELGVYEDGREKLQRATLLEVNEVIDLAPDLAALVADVKQERELRVRQEKLREIEKLQRELGPR